MNQKELKEKLKNIPKDNYIYQRHDGIIYKYIDTIDTGDYYISCETGMSCASGSCLLGKVKDNLIDLIEVGDYVNGYKVISVDYDVIDDKTECIELDLNNNYQYNFISARQIKTILTHEQFEANCYKVKEE